MLPEDRIPLIHAGGPAMLAGREEEAWERILLRNNLSRRHCLPSGPQFPHMYKETLFSSSPWHFSEKGHIGTILSCAGDRLPVTAAQPGKQKGIKASVVSEPWVLAPNKSLAWLRRWLRGLGLLLQKHKDLSSNP